MAKIIVVTAAGDEPQRESVMAERSVKWCIDYLLLKEDPVPLACKIVVEKDPRDRGGTKRVFVKVSEDESGLKPGFYPIDIDKNPAEVRRLLKI